MFSCTVFTLIADGRENLRILWVRSEVPDFWTMQVGGQDFNAICFWVELQQLDLQNQ